MGKNGVGRFALSAWRHHGTHYAPRYEESFFAKNSLITSSEVNIARKPHTCSTPCGRSKKNARQKKNTKKSAPSKTHHEIHSSPATATTLKGPATKHVPRVSLYSHASVDPGFVEIGLVHLSQSVKNTNVTDRQTDRLRHAVRTRYDEAFLPDRQKKCRVL